ncbi:hypothetical protein UFOVP700_8 [uncultured Caudovirales phage]|uniref:Uncharacterized protein n=1 Tax=uncultured Caudovirales phage TaxID=2100421 RepID=A0A6J5NI51_9CAUD|nr:hypothetical protein UFOVP700_8 [uncultured Caudovirales phage]
MVKYIVLDWQTYLSDRQYWERISQEKSIVLHVGTDQDCVTVATVAENSIV